MSESDELLDKNGSSISSTGKKKMRKYAVIAIIAIAMFAMFHVTGQKNKLPKPVEEVRPLDLGTGLLEDDIFEKFRDNKLTQSDTNVALQEQIDVERKKTRNLELLLQNILKDKMTNNSAPQIASANGKYPDLSINEQNADFPPSPNNDKAFDLPNVPDIPNVQFNTEPVADEWLGGLESMPFNKFDGGIKKKQQQLQFYQPPSFFEAKLLTGIDAMTSKDARSDPEQVFLMITAPAVLPNHIKQNLKGCFVIANATGNLAKERVQLQVVNLSCVSADGSAVIDQEVLGFVSDKDGKRDLAGNVVSRAATKMALLMVASAVGAIGDAISLSSIQQDTNAFGTSQSVDLDQLGKRTGGAAIKSVSKDYKDIILDYIRQSSPVVEIGASKDATVFLQKGVWLKIIDRFAHGKEGDNG